MFSLRAFKFAFGFLAGIATLQAHAGSCDVVNKAPAEAIVKATGDTIRLARDAWQAVRDCSRLEIVQGQVQVRGSVAGVPQTVLCATGPCALPPTSKSLTQPENKDYKLVPGGHRMDKEVVRKYGIPRGQLYAIEAATKFDFSQVSGNPVAFLLMESKSKNPVFQTPLSGKMVIIPREKLRQGVKYSWELRGSGGPAQKLAAGGFDFMAAEEAATVAKDLVALDKDSSRSAVERLFDELSVYIVHDLTYEIEVARETLRGQQ